MTHVYEQLGVPTIINAKGTSTRVSGGIMPQAVAAAMQEATQYCVDMATLQTVASRIIAEVTGAEAGIVTAGAAAGLLTGTAACVAGLDLGRMNRLPDTRGMRDEVVMVRSQRNFYDHAVRAAGVRIVEVGLPDRFSGAGMRDAEAWEIADAIAERTACVLYVAQPQARPSLPEVVEVARAAGVPVLVDAAGELPPKSNLRRFIAEGADLVAFSGGKAILGPQASGILCGRKTLIASAALQTLDMDLTLELWHPPPGLFDGLNLRGLPHHGIGRSAKVGKEQVVAQLVALRRFVDADVDVARTRERRLLQEIVDGLGRGIPARVSIEEDASNSRPALAIQLDAARSPVSALELVRQLQMGEPGVYADPFRAHDGVVLFTAGCLKEGEPAIVAARVNDILGAA